MVCQFNKMVEKFNKKNSSPSFFYFLKILLKLQIMVSGCSGEHSTWCWSDGSCCPINCNQQNQPGCGCKEEKRAESTSAQTVSQQYGQHIPAGGQKWLLRKNIVLILPFLTPILTYLTPFQAVWPLFNQFDPRLINLTRLRPWSDRIWGDLTRFLLKRIS